VFGNKTKNELKRGETINKVEEELREKTPDQDRVLNME
jgi:hypothetical protein